MKRIYDIPVEKQNANLNVHNVSARFFNKIYLSDNIAVRQMRKNR